MDLDTYIASRCALLEEKLDELSAFDPAAPHSPLFEAARYSLLRSGKRLRPLLTLATTESFGGSLEAALLPACALEVLHTYSLIHDDLPCMDDDDLRRGKPSLHKVYGEGHAVLTGDFLLTFVFQILSESPHLSSDQKLQMIQLLSKKAGAHGMVGGQAVDLLSENRQISWDTLRFIHANKTAALISVCLEFGAIISGAPEKDKALLRSLGEEIGLSFQIIDDILDVTGSEELLGKPVLSDCENQKNTSISLLGLENAKKLAETLLESALGKCQKLSISSPLLVQLLQKLVIRNY